MPYRLSRIAAAIYLNHLGFARPCTAVLTAQLRARAPHGRHEGDLREVLEKGEGEAVKAQVLHQVQACRAIRL